MAESDRRKFPRLKAPVFCRPVGLALFRRSKEQAIDISLGGVRIYSDDEVKIGSRLELELFLPTGDNIVCKAEVVWVDKLPEGSPAIFDVGLRFTQIPETDEARLAAVIDSEAAR